MIICEGYMDVISLHQAGFTQAVASLGTALTPGQAALMKRYTDNGGKYAVTHFHTLERTTAHSLVEFKLETGRKNQIRVHTADMGHPVCGDIKYGNGDDPCQRLCLHAYVLCFYHPVTHQPMEFETPIPAEFRRALKNDR